MRQTHTAGYLSGLFLRIITAAILLSACAGAALAGEIPRQNAEILLETYHSNRTRLEANSFGFPLVVESREHDNRVFVDVYGIFRHSLDNVESALRTPAAWCDIIPLFPNVKSCTYRDQPGSDLLTLYLGRKTYQPPEDARQIAFRFRDVIRQRGYLDILLNAETGPYGTTDHRIRFEALPLDGGRTYVHVSYAYSDSVALRLAAKIYFATFGRDKVGFTVTGKGSDGSPVYIGGPRGAVERNAVRCYFAIRTFLDTLQNPDENRFSMRISQWYDLTTSYRKQLFDLEKKDYLAFKAAEHKNQQALQREIATGRR